MPTWPPSLVDGGCSPFSVSVTVGFGVVLTFKPSKSVHAIAVILGIWLLIVGDRRLIQAIGASGERTGIRRHGTAVDPDRTPPAAPHDDDGRLPGLHHRDLLDHRRRARDIIGFGADDHVHWWIVLLGLISTAIGILCLVYPSLSLSIICVLVGIGMIAYGVVEIVAAFQVRALK